jgi:hypothetical protein
LGELSAKLSMLFDLRAGYLGLLYHPQARTRSAAHTNLLFTAPSAQIGLIFAS